MSETEQVLKTDSELESLVGQVVENVKLQKDSKFTIDSKNILRIKKVMLTDAELNLMDAKAYLLYVIEQHTKQTKSEERLKKIEKAKEFVIENMPEEPLSFLDVLPTIVEEDGGFTCSAELMGGKLESPQAESKAKAISNWNAQVRSMLRPQ